MNQNRQQGELHLARFHLAGQIFRRAADHHAADEHTDDDVQEHVDHTDADSAKGHIEPHPGQGQ